MSTSDIPAKQTGESTQLIASLDRSAVTPRHGMIYATVAAGHLCDGFDINLTGFVLPGIVAALSLSTAQAGFFGSSVFLGMFVGSLTIGFVADRFGRKPALMLGIGVYALFSIFVAFSWNYTSLLWLRIIEGFGLGAEVPMVFTYLSEFLPTRVRGPLLASTVGIWQFGTVIAAVVALAVLPSFGWQGMFIVGGLFGILVLVSMLGLLPRSVRHLLVRGREAEAGRVARSVSTVDPSTLTGSSVGGPIAGASILNILQGRYLRHTIGLWIMQFAGGFAFFGIAVWLPSIFTKMGFTLVNGIEYVAIITCCGAVGNFVAGLLLNRIGRRGTLAVFFVLGGGFMFGWATASSSTMILTFGALAFFFAAGGGGGPLFAYSSELYPTRSRGVGTGWGAAWQRIAGIVAPSALGLVLSVTTGSFVFFAIIGAVLIVGGLSAWLFCYETRGKTLETIAGELGG
jgi:putative MFS transporter